jgi:hypothetical protein
MLRVCGATLDAHRPTPEQRDAASVMYDVEWVMSGDSSLEDLAGSIDFEDG